MACLVLMLRNSIFNYRMLKLFVIKSHIRILILSSMAALLRKGKYAWNANLRSLNHPNVCIVLSSNTCTKVDVYVNMEICHPLREGAKLTHIQMIILMMVLVRVICYRVRRMFILMYPSLAPPHLLSSVYFRTLLVLLQMFY